MFRFLVLTSVVLAFGGVAEAQEKPFRFAGAACATPPVLHCPDKDCPSDRVIKQGRLRVRRQPADGRVVADVVRLEKGHTEGLEPLVTEELVLMMLSAKGGKLQQVR